MTEWYFEKGGQRVGPLTADELVSKHVHGDITDATLVWTEAFGAQWKKFPEANLAGVKSGPPPLPITHLNSSYAWAFALVPIGGLLLENVVRANSSGRGESLTGTFICYAAAYIVLGALDAREVERSGRVKRSVTMKSLIWFAPAYLFQRARALGQKQVLLGAWAVAFIAAIAIQSPEVLKGNIYLGAGIPPCTSSASTTQVQTVFDTIPLVKNAGITAISIESPSEVSATKKVRSCLATAELSNGNTVGVKYEITDRGDQFYYQVEIQD